MNNTFSITLLAIVFSTVSVPAQDLKNIFFDLGIEIKPQKNWVEILNAQGAAMNNNSMHESYKQPPIHYANQLPLFKYYPELQTLPYVQLCTLPTPLEKMETMSEQLATSIYIKRDDLTGNIEHGSRMYGGNKPRKLEFELGNALAQGAQAVLTFGCAGSNHAVATSEYATLLGLHCICMLKPQENSTVVQQNLLLHADNGTELHYYPSNDTRMIGTICTWIEHNNIMGSFPYIIPTGGSTPLGTIGFVNAAFELQEQISAGLMPCPDRIYLPCGSLATTVGLILGCKAAGLDTKIIGIAIEPVENKEKYYESIKTLFHKTNALLHEHDSSFALFKLDDEDIRINFDFCGTGYGIFTPEGLLASQMIKETQGVILEGTYTAKAFAALLHDIETEKLEGQTFLFWNTYCGLDFTQRLRSTDYKELPACFHSYFEQID